MPAWTPEQLAVIEHMARSSKSLIVNSVAGSGKTTTEIEGMVQRAGVIKESILMTCFNVSTRETLTQRISHPSIEIANFHRLGNAALRKGLGHFPKLEKRKLWKFIDLHWEKGKAGDVPRAIGLMKSAGWVPDGAARKFDIRSLVEDDDEALLESFDDHGLEFSETRSGLPPLDALRAIMSSSIDLALQGEVDFDDMLYIPVLFKFPFPKHQTVAIDEAQDISLIQRRMARMCLLPGGKVVAVGDRNQAIYGFRGADYTSMDAIKEEFGCDELQMTYTFRCPQAVTREAQRYVPHIQCPPTAPEGSVTSPKEWKSSDFLPSDVIICRNNKPLVQLCWELIGRCISCAILGRDIGEGLVKIAKKQGKDWDPLDKILDNLGKWQTAQKHALLAKGKDDRAASVEDQVECILIIGENLEAGAKLKDLVDAIQSMFSDDTSRLTLSTIHKAKGMEWPRVFILNPFLMPSKFAKTDSQKQQEANCTYVAVTRALEGLVYINLENIL